MKNLNFAAKPLKLLSIALSCRCIYTAATVCDRWRNHLRCCKNQFRGCADTQRSAHRLTYGQPFARFTSSSACAQCLTKRTRANGWP